MLKSPHALRCAEPDRKTLEEWARSRTQEARLVERAKMILQCVQGHAVSDIARRLRVRPNTVIDWRRRFEREGVPACGSPRHIAAACPGADDLPDQVRLRVQIGRASCRERVCLAG